jgi:hypothetical protein
MRNPAGRRMVSGTGSRLSDCTMNTANLPAPRTEHDLLTALVFHDTGEARQEALALLQRVVNRVDDGFALGVRSWCWTDLEEQAPSSPLGQQALADARQATLCVVAWSGQGRPTAGLRRLVDEWTRHHQDEPAMLAVLRLGGQQRWQLVSPVSLEEPAHEDPLHLLCPDDAPGRGEAEEIALA